MSLSNISEKLIDFLTSNLNDCETLIKSVSSRDSKKLDSIKRSLYNDIKNAEMFVDKLINRNQLKIEVRETDRFLSTPQCSHLESSFVPINIKKYVKNSTKGYVKYTMKLENRFVEIVFLFFSEKDLIKIKVYDELVRKMFVWLKILNFYSTQSCSKRIKIFCYLTPFKKVLPDNQLVVLDQNNCNTAVTTGCTENGEILLYRKEEFFKVFIHETFHVYGLDFSNLPTNIFKKKMSKLFPVKSDFLIFESYTEFWANFINTLFCTYELIDDKNDVDQFILYSGYCTRLEKIFSLYQMVKVLGYMGLQYENLFKNDEASVLMRRSLYKEDTNVLAYYVIKTILLYNDTLLVRWCLKENLNLLNFRKATGSVISFVDFIKKNHNDTQLLYDIKCLEGFNKQMNEGRMSKMKIEMRKTLRMTIMELMV